jgi:hypothetical protein
MTLSNSVLPMIREIYREADFSVRALAAQTKMALMELSASAQAVTAYLVRLDQPTGIGGMWFC